MSYTKELLYEVADLYYNKGLKQDCIARKLKISRFKVSRVLKKAKIQGIVIIQVKKLDGN
jgi:DNA-binding transcriptional regulator LsrR (DeoR family)